MLSALREATRDAHRAVERVVLPAGGRLDRSRYIRYLSKQHGFLAALEPLLDHAWRGLREDPSSHHRASLLAADLRFLGSEPDDRRCQALPEVSHLAAALGSLYVLEGQTLGGLVLLRSVGPDLGVGPGRGATFLSAYGDRTLARWQTFTAALEAHGARAPADVPVAVAGAIATFHCFQRWFEAVDEEQP